MALNIADYVVTEAGFGADLGAEKFLNIKCRKSGLWPSCAVLVATVRGIAHHGPSLEVGMSNIRKHVENLRKFKLPVVVAINRFTQDTEADLKFVQDFCKTQLNVDCVVNSSWAEGSAGSEGLGKAVIKICSTSAATKAEFLYPDNIPLIEKLRTIAKELYGAKDIDMDPAVLQKLKQYEDFGFGSFPVCVAKTQYSFSTDPKKLGAAMGHTLKVREVRLAAGAGFIVAVCGELMTMPGLPKVPSAEGISVDSQGKIQGLF